MVREGIGPSAVGVPAFTAGVFDHPGSGNGLAVCRIGAASRLWRGETPVEPVFLTRLVAAVAEVEADNRANETDQRWVKHLGYVGQVVCVRAANDGEDR